MSEVASVGGFVKQYNVVVDPNRLRAQGISLNKLRDAIRASNADVGGRTVELSEFEFMVRGRGYLKSVADIENVVLKTAGGTPLRVRDVARVELGPDERRGAGGRGADRARAPRQRGRAPADERTGTMTGRSAAPAWLLAARERHARARTRLRVAMLVFVTVLALGAAFLAAPAKAGGTPGKCTGRFVNPITDICWSCLFPLSVGGLEIWPSARPDTPNPDLPVCACADPIPRIGIAVGFWEPVRLADVTMKPWCFVNLGGLKLDPGFDIGQKTLAGPSAVGGKQQLAVAGVVGPAAAKGGLGIVGLGKVGPLVD